MFQRIQFSRVENNIPIYMVFDSCFPFEILAESDSLVDTITHSACAEALVHYYEINHLNVAKNLALYYKWVSQEIYGRPSDFAIDMWLENHCQEINEWAPNFQFSKKYLVSIKQYLKNLGCYQ